MNLVGNVKSITTIPVSEEEQLRTAVEYWEQALLRNHEEAHLTVYEARLFIKAIKCYLYDLKKPEGQNGPG